MADGTSSCVGELAQCHFCCALSSNPIRSLDILNEVFLVFLSPSEYYLEPLRDTQLHVVPLYQIRLHTFRTYGDVHYFVKAILLRLLRTKVHGVTYNNTGVRKWVARFSYLSTVMRRITTFRSTTLCAALRRLGQRRTAYTTVVP